MIEVQTFDTAELAASALNPESRYIGGGTIVMRALNYGEQDFTKIIRSTDPALREVNGSGDRIEIGAGVTMAEILSNRELEFLHPVARAIGGPAVRNMATVGGNLFARHPYGDFTAAMLALEGKVQVAGGGDQDLEDFLSSREGFSGLVKSISIARPAIQDFRFKKVSRVKPKGVSVLSIAAWLPQSGGSIAAPRIAFGAMGATPLRAKQAEAAIAGRALDASTVEAACAVIIQDLQPQDDALASAWYRSQVAGVHLRRLLTGNGSR
ncbi:MAG: FAD binding domain-containing protein [Rhizobiaceae bacterium]